MILYSDSEPGYFLYAELRRDIALKEQAFARFMCIMLCVSLGIGSVFFVIGAWPVVGFLGLDVFLVWGAFKLYKRSQRRQFDRVLLTRDGLTVEQHRGRRMDRIDYEPSFLAMHSDVENNSDPVHLCQRGKCSAIGRWLGAGERQAFMKLLKDALRQRQRALIK